MRGKSFIAMLAVLLSAVMLYIGCTYSDRGEEAGEVIESPPDPSTLTTRDDPAPKFVSKAEVGTDIRYVLSYRGRAVHIFAGVSGLLGVKVIADRSETGWDSLWLNFSPERVRPREHREDELAPEDEVNLDFVPEDLRGYVEDALQLALYLAPQDPVFGEEAASLPAGRTVLGEIELSPAAANELAIFGRTGRLAVTRNLKLPARNIPSAMTSKGNIRFDKCVSGVTYVPDGAWLDFRLELRQSHTILYVLRDPTGDYTSYVEAYKHVAGYKEKIVLDQLVTNDSGVLSADYYEPTEGDPAILSPQVRTAAGITLSLLDAGVLQPPEDFRSELIVTATLLRQREEVHYFTVEPEGPRGIEPVLQKLQDG